MTLASSGGSLAGSGGAITAGAFQDVARGYALLAETAAANPSPPNPVVTRSTMGAEFPIYGENDHPHDQFNGAVLAPNGLVFGCPDQSPDILVIDPAAGTAYRDDLGADLSDLDTKKYKGGVYSPITGLIYATPYGDTRGVLVIDPDGPTASIETMGATYTGASKWAGCVTAPDGRIFGVPDRAGNFLIIDPWAGTAVRTALTGGTIPTSTSQYSSGTLGIDGRIYCTPYKASQVLIIDPETDTIELTDFGLDLSATEHQGSVAGPDGKIYMAPWGSTTDKLLIVDPATGTAVLSAMGATLGQANGQWQSGCVAPDGRVVFVPRSDAMLLVVDTIAGTATRTNYGTTITGSSKWHSCCQALDGSIYGIPQDSPDILKIDYTQAAFPDWALLGPVLGKL